MCGLAAWWEGRLLNLIPYQICWQYGVTFLLAVICPCMYLLMLTGSRIMPTRLVSGLHISEMCIQHVYTAFRVINWGTLVLLLKHFWTNLLIFKRSSKQAAHNIMIIKIIIIIALLNHIEFTYIKITSGMYQWRKTINSKISMWRRMFLW